MLRYVPENKTYSLVLICVMMIMALLPCNSYKPLSRKMEWTIQKKHLCNYPPVYHKQMPPSISSNGEARQTM